MTSTPPSVTRNAIAEISAGPCSAVLKPHGFRRAAPQFWRVVDGLAQCVNFQASAFGSRDAGSFTVNLGISSAALFEGYVGRSLPARPVSALWPVNVRIGLLTPAGRDEWWKVGEDSDLPAVGAEVAGMIRDYAVPWFNALATRSALVRAIEEAPRPLEIVPAHVPLVLGILAAEDGDQARAATLLRTALDDYRGKPFEGAVRKVATRLGIVLDPL